MKRINDNETFSKKSINDNVNEEDRFVVGKSPRERKAYRAARELVEKFSNPKGIKFYYDVALHMSEAEIQRSYERAHRKGINSPAKYFTTICNNYLSGA